MLKIRDEVDLKELEKYGFVGEKTYQWLEKIVEYDYNQKIYYYVLTTNKIIEISTYGGYDNKLDDTLYDLIKADLVEKID